MSAADACQDRGTEQLTNLQNLPWMVALTLIVVVEKIWRYGDHLAKVVGVGLVLVGIVTAVDPRLILGW